jgi:NADH dehydrogenase (ubiquinone) 1 alpha subcomplex subunit 9
LIGRDYPTKYVLPRFTLIYSNTNRNFNLDDVHVWGASRIAEAVAKYDVDRFVHVSSFNADKNSPSEFFRTKGQGEDIVRSIFPETTLVRPAPMYGWEDKLLNKLASPANLFTSNHLKERLWPVHVIDVGKALEQLMYDDNTASETFELYGPKNYSMAEITELVDREVVKKGYHLNVPKAIRQPVEYWLNKLIWWPIGSADQVEREFIDQTIDPDAKTFTDLGIEPVELEKMVFQYLVR